MTQSSRVSLPTLETGPVLTLRSYQNAQLLSELEIWEEKRKALLAKMATDSDASSMSSASTSQSSTYDGSSVSGGSLASGLFADSDIEADALPPGDADGARPPANKSSFGFPSEVWNPMKV